jgi:hypothetical protein
MCGDALARRLRCDMTSARDFDCVRKVLGPLIDDLYMGQRFAIHLISIDVLKRSEQVQRIGVAWQDGCCWRKRAEGPAGSHMLISSYGCYISVDKRICSCNSIRGRE